MATFYDNDIWHHSLEQVVSSYNSVLTPVANGFNVSLPSNIKVREGTGPNSCSPEKV